MHVCRSAFSCLFMTGCCALLLCLHAGLMSRHKGKQFGVPFQPRGTGPDGMIDKDLKLTVPGDTYRDPYSLQVR